MQVIAGVVKINTYTLKENNLKYKEGKDSILAERSKIEVVNANHPPIVLQPHTNNLHEIACVEGPTAFLDILSPPYYSDEEMSCTYFKVLDSDGNSDSVQLRVSDAPSNFYSISLKYQGPPITGD